MKAMPNNTLDWAIVPLEMNMKFDDLSHSANRQYPLISIELQIQSR